MTRFIDIAPRLFVTELAPAIAHYEKLAFKVVDNFKDVYATMQRDGVEIHLAVRHAPHPAFGHPLPEGEGRSI